MTPDWRGHCSLPSLSATALALSQTLEGLFELTQCPSRALEGHCVSSKSTCLLCCFWNYSDTKTLSVCAARGTEVLGRGKKKNANCDTLVFVKKVLFHTDP